jgi:hypothetical protein
MREPTLKEATRKLIALRNTLPDAGAVSVDHTALWHCHIHETHYRWRLWINCDLEEFGISASDTSFELAYLQLKNKIEQWKEVKTSANPE